MKALKILEEKLYILEDIAKQMFNKPKQKYIDQINEIKEAIKELEGLPYKDRLTELEKAILDYYLSIGYKVGEGGWSFMINISTLYKFKEIQIKFCKDIKSDFEIVFRTHSETTEEMFNKAFKHFLAKGDSK